MCKISSYIVIVIILLFLSACSSSEQKVTDTPAHPASKAKSISQLRLPGGDWGLPSPFTFYPRGPGYIHLSLVYDTLVWKDERGFVPWLAEKWGCSQDGKRWWFKLRPGVYWHDGRRLTLKDVIFTFEYLKRHPVEWFRLDMLRKVTQSGNDMVTFHLNWPYAPFLAQVAGFVPIIPRHIWQTVTDPRKVADISFLVGSGPYCLKRYEKAQGAYEYSANRHFFLGRPRVERLFFVPAPDQVACLERGELSIASISGNLVQMFKAGGRFKVISGPAYFVVKIQFNQKRPPFSEARARRAVFYAIDRQVLVRLAVPGGSKAAIIASPGLIPSDSDMADKTLTGLYTYDPNRALSLLHDAGLYEDDIAGPYLLVTSSNFFREAEVVRQMLASIGMLIQIKGMDRRAVDAAIRNGQFDLAITGHGGLGADPAIVVGFGAAIRSGTMFGLPNDQEYHRLAHLLLVTMDTEKRKQICQRMQRIYARELPCIPLYYPIWFYAYDAKVFDKWFFTAKGGIGIGIPLPYNKLVFIKGNGG